jgi:predicted transcriptional regulator YdeE
LSRRALLQAGMAAGVAASGLGRATRAVADPAITPFRYREEDAMTDTRTVDLSPRFAEGSKMRVVGLAERYDAVTMNRIPEQWAHFQQRLGEVQGRFEQAQFGIFYQRGENPFAFEYVTAVMVGDDAPLPAGFVERRLPARPHAVFTHRGEPSGLRPLVDGIFHDWLPRSGRKAGGEPDFVEVYGEDFDPVRLRGVIEVWVPLAE